MRTLSFLLIVCLPLSTFAQSKGNRLAYLDDFDPYYPSHTFPKLTTPMWIGDKETEAVIILGIDDMRETKKYELFLRPILNRLKKIDGRAPLSIMTCQVDPKDPQLQSWLKEGLSIECHTIAHPCPFFKIGFEKAKKTYDDCIDLMCEIPNNKPVAFRMPCCDSLNTPSPRHWAEIFNKTTEKGNFLQIDTSVFNVFTSADPELPKDLVLNEKGEERFKRYLPKDRTFVNTIENYPYPYVIGRLCWEFPCVTPSDWSAQHLQGKNNPATLEDWKRAIDCTVIKQGVFCLVFHPHGWIKNDQIVEMIDHVQEKYGKKVKFLNFQEAGQRLAANQLGGKTLRDYPLSVGVKVGEKLALPAGARRAEKGRDFGLRFVDLNGDGELDILFSNEKEYGIYLFENMEKGWSRKVLAGKCADNDPNALPMISRNGTNNGFFVHSGYLWWANEDTVLLKDHVDRRSIKELLNTPQAQGQRPLGNETKDPGPLSPEESLKCLKPRPGFKAELMAAEPLVMDPIAFAWGPDGKFWVVEMGDYPLGADGKGKFGGKIKILTKSKASLPRERGEDGPYDTAVTFMDNLGYPTGVMPWGKGVLVSCAPDIFYAEDTDGDGKADKKVVLFTGFGEGNQQHRVNGFTYGLDNHVYGANGDSGGKIKARAFLGAASGDFDPHRPVDIRGRDFVFDPDTGYIEPVAGQTQFVRARDDWGNWFGNNNSNPMWHFVLDDQYQSRNRHLPSPDPRVPVSVRPGAAPVFPISKPLPRFNSPAALNHFTSACSAIVYRDDLFGPQFKDNTFVSEPVHNLIHREVMRPKGITFSSQRAPDEQNSEFLASTDNWFRPAMIQTGPDGALWVADMYRYVIEHPQWIPIDWQKKLELRAGHDKGRIYRIYPEAKKPRTIPRLDNLSTNELVAALDSPSGWQRDTAQQLLFRKHDKSAVAPLMKLLREAKNPLARLHALCTLNGLVTYADAAALGFVDLALKDPHPGVRVNAVRIAGGGKKTDELLLALVDDPEPAVQLRVAYTLGWDLDHAKTGEALGRLAARHAGDKYFVAAVFSSVNPNNFAAVVQGAIKRGAPPTIVFENLLRLANAYNDSAATLMVLRTAMQQQLPTAERFTMIANLVDSLESQRVLLEKLKGTEAGQLQALFEQIGGEVISARRKAGDVEAPLDTRAAALRLLGRHGNLKEDLSILAGFVSPQTAEELQSAAIAALGKVRDPSATEILLKSWRSLLPAQRNQVVDVFLSRQDLLASALAALEKKQIAPLEIDATRRQQLLDHKNLLVRNRARKIFAGAVDADRAKVIEAHRPVIAMKGDVTSGAKVFTKSCAACHQLAGVGQQVGPDLASVKDKTPDVLLIAMLDPNRAVEARYVNYSAVTKAGLTYSGLLASETGTSITLVGVDGKKHTVLRTDIDELYSTGKSVMPEGLEKDLSHKDMADLIAFLRQNLPAVGRKSFVGNDPNWVRNTQDGTLHLTAKNCEIYGSTLVFEGQYSNLGHWSSADDKAVWQLELSQPGKYAVWLDWACDASAAGNAFVLQVADQKLTGKVESTGGWDNYRQTKIGEITLEVGRQEFVMQSVGAIRGGAIDLREIKLVPVR